MSDVSISDGGYNLTLRGNKKNELSESGSVSTLQELEKGTTSRFISKEVKAKFIDFITNRNFSMKQAAKMVKMSYSTAKKIYRRFRNANVSKNSERVGYSQIQASYRQIGEIPFIPISVTCLIAGSIQNCSSFQQS